MYEVGGGGSDTTRKTEKDLGGGGEEGYERPGINQRDGFGQGCIEAGVRRQDGNEPSWALQNAELLTDLYKFNI
jgi:hypothetical protein